LLRETTDSDGAICGYKGGPARRPWRDARESPLKVLIVGGGVAALEALIALRGLAAERVSIELATPEPYFTYRPLAVAEPFGLGEAKRYDVVEIAAAHGAAVHLAGVQRVDAAANAVETWDGRSLRYDVLLVAIGAKPVTAVPGSITVKGPGYTGRFRGLLRELANRSVQHVAFAVPPGASWPLPLYELALMTANEVSGRGVRGARVSLITPEVSPLELFGPRASKAAQDLLDAGHIELHTGCSPVEFEGGELSLVPEGIIAADRVVSLPRLIGPRLPGLPADPDGFIPVDLSGLVAGEQDVYAAGDATTSPIKQGGIATQQADAAAEAIAARAGAQIEPQPFRPVLRGLLLTGSKPRYMRADVSGGSGGDWAVAEHALWWPPSKIAGRWLAPYLALRHAELEESPAGLPVDVAVAAIRLSR
jgi:sulfide:quinone oxidoreductase